jgi:hypothetical protein
MSRVRGSVVAVLVALLVSSSSAGLAAASPIRSPDAHGLAHGWGSAKACMVSRRGAVECFATEAALRTRSDQIRGDGLMSGGCPVYLYSGSGWTGNVLELWGRGGWMNLADWGFDKATVSFIGTGCGFHLAERAWGGGWWYPGYTGTYAYTSDMGWCGWDWRVSSVYIN